MDTVSRQQFARVMRSQGMKLREIAKVLDTPMSTVGGWCADPDGRKSKARKERYRRPCIDCGRLVSGSNGHGPKAPLRCQECGARLLLEWNERHDHECRMCFIRLWNLGIEVNDLADEMGWTVASVRSRVSLLRAQGYDLHYRHHYSEEGLAKARETMLRNRRTRVAA